MGECTDAQQGKVLTLCYQALARLREVIGEPEFADRIRTLPPALRAAYEGSTAEALEEGSEEGGVGGGVEFGFVPARLVAQLRNGGNFQLRGQAISELQRLLLQLDSHSQQQVVPHLSSLSQLLAGFLDDTNFKISITSLEMISDVLDRFGDQIRHGADSVAIASAIIPKLMEKFADNKIVIRQSNLKVPRSAHAWHSPPHAYPPRVCIEKRGKNHRCSFCGQLNDTRANPPHPFTSVDHTVAADHLFSPPWP